MPVWVFAMGLGAELVMGLLAILSVWSVAIMIDRYRAFQASYHPEETSEAKTLIRGRNLKALGEWATARQTLSAVALKAALEMDRGGPEQIERSVRSSLVEEKTKLERGLTVLATLGSNAPFIGLFGTVLGIIKSFAMLSQNQSGMSGVMSGIAEALISTAVGLFVAIPAVVAYNIFSRKLKTALGECEALRDLYLSRLAGD